MMKTPTTTHMSSKGQITIPESIRKRLNLKAGTQFLVFGNQDIVILKVFNPPDMNEFDELIKQTRKQAREAGLKRRNINSAVSKARHHNEKLTS